MKRLLSTAALLACILPAAAHGPEADLSAATLAQIADARRATAAFHDLSTAIAAGYGPGPFADAAGIICIDKPGTGAMGVHYVNGGLLNVNLSPLAPQALIYEPMPGGTLRLVGAEYIVFQAAWDGAFTGTTPRLFGQDFHLAPAGNRYDLPPFYALHMWMWQPNRSGMFADWNPSVRCP